MPISGEVTTRSGRPSDSLFNDHRQPVPQRPRPPHFFPKSHHSVDNFGPFVETQRTTVSPLYGVTRQSCQAILATHGLAKTNLQSYFMILEKKFATKNVDAQAPKRTRSPPIPSADEVSQENSHLSRNDKIQAVLEACVCPRLVELLLYVPICFILLHYDIDFKFGMSFSFLELVL